MGHLKERSLKDQLAKDPTEVIRKAVLRMLPRNKLRDVSVIPENLHSLETLLLFFDKLFLCGNDFYLIVH